MRVRGGGGAALMRHRPTCLGVCSGGSADYTQPVPHTVRWRSVLSVLELYAKEDSVSLLQGAVRVHEDTMAKIHVR